MGVVPPLPACYDNAANYRWVQYGFVPANPITGTGPMIERYNDTAKGCTQHDTFSNIGGLTISYVDESPAPQGGSEPFAGQDNNVAQIDIQWVNPADPSHPSSTTSEVVLRSSAYTNVANGLDVSNPPLGASPPPARCP